MIKHRVEISLAALHRVAPGAGLIGAGATMLGVVLSALAYSGRTGEPYSFLNHFVSELGERGISELAAAFNIGLLVGGLCLAVLTLGVAREIGSRVGRLFGLVGVVTGISGALVGVFPMDNLAPHALVAMTFFYASLFTMALFSLVVLLSRRRAFPRWLAIPGLLATASTFAFLFLTEPVEPEGDVLQAAVHFLANRPDVWATAILEWAVIVSLLIWVTSLSVWLLGYRIVQGNRLTR